VSTFTIEVKPLPDWVVGTFEGCCFSNPDFDGTKNIWTTSKLGVVTCKASNAIYNETASARLVKLENGNFQACFNSVGEDKWGSYEF
jgi:hypothetical protein